MERYQRALTQISGTLNKNESKSEKRQDVPPATCPTGHPDGRKCTSMFMAGDDKKFIIGEMLYQEDIIFFEHVPFVVKNVK